MKIKGKAFDTEEVVEMSEIFVFYEMLSCGNFYGQNTEGSFLFHLENWYSIFFLTLSKSEPCFNLKTIEVRALSLTSIELFLTV